VAGSCTSASFIEGNNMFLAKRKAFATSSPVCVNDCLWDFIFISNSFKRKPAYVSLIP
jgi:hypothetical protein